MTVRSEKKTGGRSISGGPQTLFTSGPGISVLWRDQGPDAGWDRPAHDWAQCCASHRILVRTRIVFVRESYRFLLNKMWTTAECRKRKRPSVPVKTEASALVQQTFVKRKSRRDQTGSPPFVDDARPTTEELTWAPGKGGHAPHTVTTLRVLHGCAWTTPVWVSSFYIALFLLHKPRVAT